MHRTCINAIAYYIVYTQGIAVVTVNSNGTGKETKDHTSCISRSLWWSSHSDKSKKTVNSETDIKEVLDAVITLKARHFLVVD